MNGSDIKKVAIEKAKAKVSQAQQAVNGSNNGTASTKKKRKGDQLKPIITTEPASPATSTPLHHTQPGMKGAYANQLSRSPSSSSGDEDGQSVQDEEDTEGEHGHIYSRLYANFRQTTAKVAIIQYKSASNTRTANTP
jgi:hypothetical protein